MSTRHYFFPRTRESPKVLQGVVAAFDAHQAEIATDIIPKGLASDQVLRVISPELKNLGFEVEAGKRASQKIKVPVLFGEGGGIDLHYEMDAFHHELGCGLEIEAGRAVSGGNAIYRDLFQAIVMPRVRTLIVAVPLLYRSNARLAKGKGEPCYEKCVSIADTLYSHQRVSMPFELGIVGY